MPRSLWAYRTSTRMRRCDSEAWECCRVIQPGERYLRISFPPGGEFGYYIWWHQDICSSCMAPEKENYDG